MIAEKGVVSGVSAAASLLGSVFWDDVVDSSGLLRSVREAEERRSVTAEVAETIGLTEDSIWDEL